jgi:hypothetical protein
MPYKIADPKGLQPKEKSDKKEARIQKQQLTIPQVNQQFKTRFKNYVNGLIRFLKVNNKKRQCHHSLQ